MQILYAEKSAPRRVLLTRCLLLFSGLCLWAASSGLFSVTPPAGLAFLHQNSPSARKHLIETMGGGVAVFDYNNDGLLDVFLVNSGAIQNTPLPKNEFERENPRYWNRLFRQNRDGTFTDMTDSAGLAHAGDGNYGMGVATGDFDNDGWTDLYITNYGHNALYRNNGNGTFTDVTQKAGVAAGGWSASAGFVDYDNDGKLDLFVTRYMEWDFGRSKVCGTVRHTYCPPGEFPAATNRLYRNRGDGTFEDVSATSGIASHEGRSLGVAFNDYDGDGFTDIFVANDGMQQFLYRNNGNGTFIERALEAGVALSDDGKPFAGMGVDFRDYDNDGRPDIVVTNLARQVYALYHNDGNGQFSYRSLESGLGALSAGSSGWGLRLEDFDNDGWKDVLIAQSHVMDNVEQIDPELRYAQPPLLALNHEGHFERASSGSNTPVAGRGLAFGDLNNDGLTDAVMSVLGGSPVVFRNQSTTAAHWLTIALRGTRSNRDGMGAIVTIGNQGQYATSAGSYLSASDKRVHFGLANITHADVTIRWPSGIRQTLQNVPVDQIITAREPEQP